MTWPQTTYLGLVLMVAAAGVTFGVSRLATAAERIAAALETPACSEGVP